MRSSTRTETLLLVSRHGWNARPFIGAFLPALLLLITLSAELSGIRQMSPTYDEHEYITRGYLYLKTGDTRLKLRHPILLDVIAAAPLLLLTDIRLPLDDPALAAGDFHAYARVFFWELNEPLSDQMIFLARLPKIYLMMMLAAGVFRWAKEKYGFPAGAFAAIFTVLDPNLLAHGRLATPDVGQTTFIFFATYTWWYFLQRPGLLRLLLAGIVLGLAQTAGFPALILYPTLALISVVHSKKGREAWPMSHLLGALAVASLVSFVVIWGIYRFQWGVVSSLGVNLPAPYHWEELLALFHRLGREDLSYLNGEVYRGGRWSFFVIALLIKTPIPTLVLTIVGIVTLIRRKRVGRDFALWGLPVLYFGISLNSSLNIGYRHILPILPFVLVLGSASVDSLSHLRWQWVVLMSLTGWLLCASLWISPSYLAYFNELVGGPAGGRHYLVVSDLDWGQDLPGLKEYLQQENADEIYLSWFGTAPPEHYGIDYRPLPAWPPRGNEGQYPFHPDYPLPGLYAISVANLEGARFEQNRKTFAWFWDKAPQAIIGHTIFVYHVPRLLDTETYPANVILAPGTSLADLPSVVVAERLRTNDLHPRWLNGPLAMVFPERQTIMLLNSENSLDLTLQERFIEHLPQAELWPGRSRNVLLDLYDLDMQTMITSYLKTKVKQTVYVTSASLPSIPDSHVVDLPVNLDNTVDFLGYETIAQPAESTEPMKLLTVWQVRQRSEQPMAIFVHLLASDGSILSQHDGLDVSTDSWYPGDILVQVHPFDISPDLLTDAHWAAVGMYRTDTKERLHVNLNASTGQALNRMFIEVASVAP